MDIRLAPGKYVVAVSGGVDSMALLDVLCRQPGLDLVIAHFDHGVRPDSAEDALLVRRVAEHLAIPFVSASGNLGVVSEATARTARYAFLRQVAQQHGGPIVTAHHQDDVLETAILNLVRGTGRRGLTSLRSTSEIVRPLLAVPKTEMLAYAKEHNLVWHEDSTNDDMSSRRNYIRHRIMPRLGDNGRAQLLTILHQLISINDELDATLLVYVQPQLNRRQFIRLPHAVSREVIAAWLRSHSVYSYDRKTLERIVAQAKTLAPGKSIDVVQDMQILIGFDHLALTRLDR